MNLSPDSKFFAFMSKVGDCIALNLLFILTCIPVFTIGASICAMYCTCKKRIRDEESYITRDYLSAWKENFKNATIIWLFFLALLPALYLFSSYFTAHLDNILVLAAYILAILWYSFSLLYAFPLQASFVNSPFHIIRNSILTALIHLPYTLLLFTATILPAALTFLFPGALYFTFAYWLLIGFSLSSICSVLITERVFQHYRP